MKHFFQDNKTFIISSLTGILVLSYFLMFYSKTELHIAVNEQHTPYFDFFFKYLTHLGDALVTYILVVILLFEKYRLALLLMVSNLIETVFVQGIKNSFTSYRPKKYFEEFVPDYTLYLVPDVKVHSYMSFPSGHTATAIVMFFFLAIWLANGKPLVQVLFFLVAFVTAFSRVYLSQHFFIDVCAGIFFGLISVMLGYWWIMGIKSAKLDGKLSFKKS